MFILLSLLTYAGGSGYVPNVAIHLQRILLQTICLAQFAFLLAPLKGNQSVSIYGFRGFHGYVKASAGSGPQNLATTAPSHNLSKSFATNTTS
jgi:hypothetical protein